LIRQFLFRALDFLLSRTFNIRIIKDYGLKTNKIGKKIFGNSKLIKSSDGYWKLSPMPTEDELNTYYESRYWSDRNGKDIGTNTRDLVHYQVIQTYCSTFNKGNTFLNFGAGNGGVSHLAWLNGMDVINVEPSHIPQYYNDRWNSFKSFSEVPDNSCDLFYSSHSLEHVQDLDKFLKNIKRVVKKSGIFFFEVPNSEIIMNNILKNKIEIPHTYYFTKIFFNNLFDTVILNQCFDNGQRLTEKIGDWKNFANDNGSVIRAIGKIS
jgi:SAM-dependent methyltransferase